MIIWINGGFGAGKTQTAFELHGRIPGSIVYDPERAGYLIRSCVPKSAAKDDFQDYEMWREFNSSMLRYLEKEQDGVVLVPMTIANPRYFDEIIGKLRDDGAVVHHYTLCASRETLIKRLRGRGEGERSWAAQQIDRCLQGQADERFRHHLETDRLSIEEVAETIAGMSNITLLPDRTGKLGRAMDRVKTQLRHIRFFG